MSRWLLSGVLLVLVYALALASFAPLDLLLGALLAAAVLGGLRRHLFRGPPLREPALAWRLVRFVPFAAAAVWEIVTGTVDVAVAVLVPARRTLGGIVEVPIGERSDTGVVASAIALTLSPGSVLVDVDWKRRVMFVHVLDATDPQRTRDEFDEFYRRYQKPVFP